MVRSKMIRPNDSSSSSSTTPTTSPSGYKKRIQFGEVVGGTAAECAAVCCCCPFGLMNILILIIYKLPAGAWKKALKTRKRKTKKKRAKKMKNNSCLSSYYGGDCYEDELEKQNKVLNSISNESSSFEEDEENIHMFRNRLSQEVMELDEEMFDRFRGAGFWRSPSQVSQRYT